MSSMSVKRSTINRKSIEEVVVKIINDNEELIVGKDNIE